MPSHEDASQKVDSRSRLNGLLAAQSEEEGLEGIVEVAQEADVPEEEADTTEKEAVAVEEDVPSEAITIEIRAILNQFEALLSGIMTVVGSDESQLHYLELFLARLDACVRFAQKLVVQRLWAGERDVTALTKGLDDKAALLVRQMLERLEND